MKKTDAEDKLLDTQCLLRKWEKHYDNYQENQEDFVSLWITAYVMIYNSIFLNRAKNLHTRTT